MNKPAVTVQIEKISPVEEWIYVKEQNYLTKYIASYTGDGRLISRRLTWINFYPSDDIRANDSTWRLRQEGKVLQRS